MQLGNIWLQDLHVEFERAVLPLALDRHEYHLLDKNYNNKDVFDLFTHHILHSACEEILACVQLGHKYVLYHDTSWELKKSDYLGYTADVQKAVKRLENLIPRILPAYIIEQPYDMYEFLDKLDAQEVEVVEKMEKLKAKIDRNAFKSFNLNKIIKYLDQRGLKFLSSDYFQQANSKLLAANK